MTHKYKKSILTTMCILVVGALLTALSMPKKKGDEVLWREYPVQKGNITASLDGGGVLELSGIPYSMDTDLKLKKLSVEVGDFVNSGDVIAEFDEDSIDQKLKELSNELKIAQRQLDDAIGNRERSVLEKALSSSSENLNVLNQQFEQHNLQVTQQRSWVMELQEQLKQTKPPLSQAELNNYKAELNRLKHELNQNTISDTLLIQKQNRIATLEQEIQASEERKNLIVVLNDEIKRAEENLRLLDKNKRGSLDNIFFSASDNSIQRQIDWLNFVSLDRAVQGATENVEKIKSQISDWQKRKKNLVLKAENDGVVTELPFKVGETVPSGKSVVVLGDDTARRVKVLLSQEDIGSIELGQVVEMQFLATPDQTLTGKVTRKSLVPTQGNDGVTYSVWIEFDEEHPELLQGMTCSVQFILKRVEQVLTLSNKAITLKDGKQTVTLRLPDGTLEERVIRTGFSDGRVSEIKSGLADGDVVVVEG